MKRLTPIPPPEEPPIAEAIGPAIVHAVASLIASSKPATEAQLRRFYWREFILPRLAISQVPKRFQYELGDWDCEPQRKVYEHCRKVFGRGGGAIVALVGSRGTGKTTIASQLVVQRAWEDLALMPDTMPSRATPYRKLSSVIARFKSLYADHGSTDTDALTSARNALCEATLAIFDEVHDCEDMKLKDRVLTDVIDRRYGNMVDTLLITNQTEKEFRETTSDSVLSRISELGTIIRCEWPSWREGGRNPLHA